eukprot:Opistho-2@34429
MAFSIKFASLRGSGPRAFDDFRLRLVRIVLPARLVRKYSTTDGESGGGKHKRGSGLDPRDRNGDPSVIQQAADHARVASTPPQTLKDLKLGLFYDERVLFPTDRLWTFRIADEARLRMITAAIATHGVFGHIGGFHMNMLTTREHDRPGVRAIGRAVSPDVGCMMRIVQHDRLPSGALEIQCSAVQRIRVSDAEWTRGSHWRASVMAIDDEPMEDEDELRAIENMERIKRSVSGWKTRHEGGHPLWTQHRRNITWLLGSRPGIAGIDWTTYSYRVASIVSDMRKGHYSRDKEHERLLAMLSTTDVEDRLRLVIEHMDDNYD